MQCAEQMLCCYVALYSFGYGIGMAPATEGVTNRSVMDEDLVVVVLVVLVPPPVPVPGRVRTEVWMTPPTIWSSCWS